LAVVGVTGAGALVLPGGVPVGVDVGAYQVDLGLQVQVLDAEGIGDAGAELYGEFVRKAGVAFPLALLAQACAHQQGVQVVAYVVDAELIDVGLSVERQSGCGQPPPVESDGNLVGIADVVFDGAVEDNGVQVVGVEAATARRVGAAGGHVLEQPQLEAPAQVQAQMMSNAVLGIIGPSDCTHRIIGQPRPGVLILEEAVAGAHVQKQVVVRKVAQQQRPDTTADAQLVLPELQSDMPGGLQADIAPRGEVVHSAVLERLGPAVAGDGPAVERPAVVIHIAGQARLVLGQEGVKAHTPTDHPAHLHPARVPVQRLVRPLLPSHL